MPRRNRRPARRQGSGRQPARKKRRNRKNRRLGNRGKV